MVSAKIINASKTIKAHNLLRILFIFLIFIFALLPLFFLLGNIDVNDLRFVFNDSNFYSALVNSFLYSLAATFIVVFLALLAAYFINTSSIRYKKLLVILLTIPMLVPTLSIGLGLRVLGGSNGFLDLLLHINLDFIGFFGLIVGSIIVGFPPAFIVLYDSLRYENKECYDAASIMGIRRISTFFHVTIPYLKGPIITAFLACFTLIFSDYGVPMEIAGQVKTLPMYLYEHIVSSFKYGRAAIVGIFLLLPALLSFVIDIIIKDEKGDELKETRIKPSKLFNSFSFFLSILIFTFLFIPQLSFISLAFMKGYPNNITFSFDNILNVFSNVYGVGLSAYIVNSLVISLLTGIFGSIFAFLAAYLSTRFTGKIGFILNFFAMASVAIPGIVLGVGYIFMFKDTSGIFYGTIVILVVANVFHFLGSPFVMAKNTLLKINKDYEVVGDTLGISKIKILTKVLVPNSIISLLEMFSYFFVNSMITISAVAFLCTYKTQPLSILITTYEITGNYEMQATISFIILSINVIFKCALWFVEYFLMKYDKNKKEDIIMPLTRTQFSILAFLEKNGKRRYTQRELSDNLKVSLGTVNKELKALDNLNYISSDNNDVMFITEKGLKAIEPYKVRKAIILAAGFGSRLAPVTLDIPKPLVPVNGTRIIDTLLDALVNKGITNITIVRGYKKEQFDQLLKKYPFVQFVDNDEYNITNNISSVMKVVDRIDRCYICEADLFIKNPDVICKYEYATCFLGTHVNETDDWCFKKTNRYITDYGIGGEDCYQAFGISYWNEKDSRQYKNDIIKLYNSKGGKENIWDGVPLIKCKKNYKIEVKECLNTDIVEIDNFYELIAIDNNYVNYHKEKNE